jgi:hypothetical protein
LVDLELWTKWFANGDVSKVRTSTKNCYARAGAAAGPYAEDLMIVVVDFSITSQVL